MRLPFGFLCLGVAMFGLPMRGTQSPGNQLPPPPPASSSPATPAASSPAQQPAQQPGAHPPAAQPDEGGPLTKLGLSDQQKSQIHGIRQKSQEQVQAVKSDTSLSPQQQSQQIRQIRHKANQQVESILTPEQREKYDAWRRAHERRHRPPPPSSPGV